MSTTEGKCAETSSTASVDQGVGWRRPPVEHRFKPGQSGNPRGRPPGTKNRKPEQPGPLELPGEQAILDEMWAPVTIVEGGKLITVSGVQAVVKALKISGLKGNRLAAKHVMELLQSAEAQKRVRNVTKLEEARTYKIRCYQEIERCRLQGLPEPLLLPHPDDVVIDERTGTVDYLGPMTIKEKAWWNFQLEARAEEQAKVSAAATRHREAVDPEIKESALEEWLSSQRMFDLLNDRMRGRYRVNLDDRSYHPDASREGDFQSELDPMRTAA